MPYTHILASTYFSAAADRAMSYAFEEPNLHHAGIANQDAEEPVDQAYEQVGQVLGEEKATLNLYPVDCWRLKFWKAQNAKPCC